MEAAVSTGFGAVDAPSSWLGLPVYLRFGKRHTLRVEGGVDFNEHERYEAHS